MKIRTFVISALTLLLVAWVGQPSAQAQLTLTGTNYTEGFESIGGGSLPSGWTCRWQTDNSPPVGPLGTELPFTNGIATWTGGDQGKPWNMASVHNIDSATTNLFVGTEDIATQNAATNRAPGQELHSSTDGETSWTLQIADTLGFSDFTVSMDLLVLTTASRTGIWDVEYAVGNAPTTFTPLGSMGDLPGNAFGATNSGVLVIPADANNQGQNLWIRLANNSNTQPSGSRDTYGIDNFVLNYTAGVVNTDPPSITTEPQSITNNAGQTALFTVEAEGAPILAYQWRKNGAVLGAPSLASLSLPEVVTADAGNYDVVITNDYGSITSLVATLTVEADPGLIGSFASLTNMPGDAIRVGIDVAGTLPKTYQWQKDGVAIGGASGELTNDVVNTVGYTLTTNATSADEGTYSLVVSNSLGVVTGDVASVTITPTPSTRLASWNFNSVPNDDDDTTGVDTPFVGAGTLFLAPLTTTFEWRGGADVDVADLELTNDNSAYRARGVNTGFNLESGIEVLVDTTGYQDILVSWNENHNTRASRYMRFQYSTDGFNFIDATGFSFADLDGTWLLLTDALYGVAGVENNPNFAFRIVAEWESTAGASANDVYDAAASGSGFSAANGVMIFDLLTVWANPLGTVSPPTVITDVAIAGVVVTVTFTSETWDSASEFTLEGASTVDGIYSPVAGAVLSDVSPGVFQATAPVAGSMQYYRIKQ